MVILNILLIPRGFHSPRARGRALISTPASSNKYGSCGRSCAVVCGRTWSVMRGRARSCAVSRTRSRACVGGRARSVVRAWSVIRGRTNERTTSNNPLNPPGVGWVNLFYLFKVRVSIRICVPNLGSFRRPYRKWCLSNL